MSLPQQTHKPNTCSNVLFQILNTCIIHKSTLNIENLDVYSYDLILVNDYESWFFFCNLNPNKFKSPYIMYL